MDLFDPRTYANVRKPLLEAETLRRGGLQADRVLWHRRLPMVADCDVHIAAESSEKTHQAFDGHVAELSVEEP